MHFTFDAATERPTKWRQSQKPSAERMKRFDHSIVKTINVMVTSVKATLWAPGAAENRWCRLEGGHEACPYVHRRNEPIPLPWQHLDKPRIVGRIRQRPRAAC